MIDLALLQQANSIAKNYKAKNLHDFTLKNPLKLNPELLKLVLNQLNFNNKVLKKMPFWQDKNLLAPPTVSFEQSSSEFTAKFKSNLFTGKFAADLTGGFGVDSFFLAQAFEKLVYVEQNEALTEIVADNFKTLGVSNVRFINQNCEDFIKIENQKFDLIYIDPARRDDSNKKLVRIEECQPNVISVIDLLLELTDKILIKFSPLLDLKLAISTIKNLKHIYVLSERNEVKEVLISIEKNYRNEALIHCINQKTNGEIENFDFLFSDETDAQLNFGFENKYLYEPNASIMKAGAFKSIAQRFNLTKLATNSHLYSSLYKIDDFPGRRFEIIEVLKYDKKEIQLRLPHKKANIIARNFVKKPDQIKKELDLIDGGEMYLYFSENSKKEKVVFWLTPI